MKNYIIRVYSNEANKVVARLHKADDGEEFIIHTLEELGLILGIKSEKANKTLSTNNKRNVNTAD
ncbi:MAG: hypothetical protein OEY29_14280 [Gammaproteobacteria bacterium]|nr:hypothetical protein [Gammaproteobacteria bacterium]